jgi:cytochrome P450
MYDPPAHSRLRKLVAAHFTPRAVAELGARVEATIEGLLEPMLQRGEADLVQDLAIPLSLGLIADLIGVPAERRADFRRWSEGVIDVLAGGLDEEATVRAAVKQRELVAFLKVLMNERAASHSDARDIISLLVHARGDDRLTPSELIAFCVVLLVAGFETTVNGIANGALALMAHRDQLRLLVDNPGLAPSMVEEVVRYDCPVQSFFRNTLRDTAVAGVPVPSGVKVLVLFASANRDPRHFPEADRFLVSRSPNDHVGFGAGVHFCLGAPLARLQMVAVARAMLASVRSMDLCGSVVRTGNVLFRGVRRLPVAVRPR